VLPAPLLPENKKAVQNAVTAEQVYVMDAVIVRYMKSHKSAPMQQLAQDVPMQCLYFKATPRDVKQRVEDLMRRKYLAREDPDDPRSNLVYLPGGGD
jgi:hypothetical protein